MLCDSHTNLSYLCKANSYPTDVRLLHYTSHMSYHCGLIFELPL